LGLDRTPLPFLSALCECTKKTILVQWHGVEKNTNKQLLDKKIHVGCSENIWVSCTKTPSAVEKTQGTVWGLENHVVRMLKN